MNAETPKTKADPIQFVIDNLEPKKIDIKIPDESGVESAQLFVVPKNMEVINLKPLLDEYKKLPERRIGQHVADDLGTFIDITNRFKSPDSVVFAKADITDISIKASLTAILDFHPMGAENTATGHGDHRVLYQYPISKELKFWMSRNMTEFAQTAFAILLEERINEMVSATEEEKNAITNLKPNFADPITILELSRDLEIYSNERVKQAGKLQSGERKLEFTVEHVDAKGAPVTIPDFFILQIPIFDGGAEERIFVRLRYRKKGESVVWFYDLYRIDKVFEASFNVSLSEVQEKTGLPLYVGSAANAEQSE